MATVPNLLELMMFRMRRSAMKVAVDEGAKDYQYFSEQGWLNSDYYYPVQLGLFKKSASRLFDSIFAQIYKGRTA